MEPTQQLPVVNSPGCRSKPGRKPWRPPDLEQVEALASSGLTYAQIADALGIHAHTLLRKRSQFAALAEALKRGRAKGISAVANKLYELALAGNVVACIFFLKCQGGWREIQQVDISLVEAEKRAEARQEQLQLIRTMTPEERQVLRESNGRMQELMDRARQRLKQAAPREQE
ncbi:MAG: hypothetical protein JO166_13825 [Deltaproteobacteria bacterium]|nr:hypothetical protein [Deltaproteobacteria bacterium]